MPSGEPNMGEDRKRMRRIIILGAAVLVGIWLIVMQRTPAGGPRPGAAIEVGQAAPAFELKDLDGNQVSLEDFKGKIVMLDFWATWCGPCRLTMPVLEKLQKEHPGQFTLLAINIGETQDQVAPYVKSRNIEARVLLDLNENVAAAYRASSIPMQVIIDQQGIVRYIWAGYHDRMGEDLWAEIAKLQQ